MDDLLDSGDVRMVIIVSHRDHRCVRKSPAKAPGADLPVEPREGLTTHTLLREDVWIFSQDFADGVVLSVQLFLVLNGCEDESIVLNCEDVVLRPIAEELDVWHQVEVRRPERIFSLLIFINDEDEKNELVKMATQQVEEIAKKVAKNIQTDVDKTTRVTINNVIMGFNEQIDSFKFNEKNISDEQVYIENPGLLEEKITKR